MTRLLILLALAMPAQAQAPARAEIDCGTLQGSGVVRVMVDGRILRVDVNCGRAV
jgi:hypothetical protein